MVKIQPYTRPLLALIGVALLITACGGASDVLPPAGGNGPGEQTGDPAHLSGTVLFQQGAGGGGVLEAEPNDSAFGSHYLGYLTAGQEFSIHGSITALAGLDPFDGFQFVAPERVEVAVRLDFSTEGGNDFDVGVLEFSSLQFAEVFDTDSAPEAGTFHAKGLFDVVVRATAGNGDYVLTVTANTPQADLLEREPNSNATESQFLGNIDIGDVIRVTGLGDAAADPRDGILLATTSPMRLAVDVDYGPGVDYDVSIWNVTSGLDSPSRMNSFGTGQAASPASGYVIVGGTRLLHVQVEAQTGSGAWTLTVRAENPATPVQATANAVGKPIATLRSEQPRWRRIEGQEYYTRPGHSIVPGEVIVACEPGTVKAAQAEILARGGRTPDRISDVAARVIFDGPSLTDSEEQARWTLTQVASLRTAPGIAYAEPNYVFQAFATPDDEHYNLQWNYPLIHLPEAWNITTGASNVIVAVIDTGRTSHPDLTGRQSGGYDFISSTSISLDGNGIDSDPTDPGDQDNPDGSSTFHGTHVAGTIGATTDNDRGVAGVTWSSQIMHLRVLGRGGGTTYDIAQAIRYAARLSNDSGTLPTSRANVINMSLGGGGFSQTMANAISAARDAGVVIFAAAGNESSSTPSYPAAHSGVISVAAVDLNGKQAWYSNTGTTIDIAAPGGDTRRDLNGDGQPDGVLSTLYDDSETPSEAIYAFYQGTSMACPHAVGVAALVLAIDPTFTPAEVEEILTSTADDLGTTGRDNIYGHGLVNAYAAVLAAQNGGGGSGPPVLLLNPTSLSFSYDLESIDVRVSNGGGEMLTIQGVSTSTQSGGDWITASTYGTGDADQGVDGVRVEVDRSDLDPGIYVGLVTVESNGGEADIEVLVAVRAEPPPLPDVDIFVRAIDAASGDVVAEVIVNPRTNLEFMFEKLPPGAYYIAAGSDLDGDGEICGEGGYCGMYPVSGSPTQVELAAGEQRSGIEFTVGPYATIPLGVPSVLTTRGASQSELTRPLR